jgi:hypothetical protein
MSLNTFKQDLCKEVSSEIRNVVKNEMKNLVPTLCNDLHKDLRYDLSDSITSNVSRNLCSSLRTHLVHCMEQYNGKQSVTVSRSPHVKPPPSLSRKNETPSSRKKNSRKRSYHLDDQSPLQKKVKVCQKVHTKTQSTAVKYVFSKPGKVRFMCFKVNENERRCSLFLFQCFITNVYNFETLL